MKLRGWIVGAVVVGGVVIATKGGCLSSKSGEPDQRFVKRMDEMCKIARDNADSPVKGVKKLGVFFVKHTGDLMKDFGDSITTIERIADDQKHDDRARLTRKRWMEQGQGCAADWMRFADAVENNEEASEMVERVNVRLGRTFEIIFGEGAAQLDLLSLPMQLENALDAKLDRVIIRK